MRTIKGWVDRSYKVPNILKEIPIFAYDFQSVGRFDLELSYQWEKIRKEPNYSILGFDDHVRKARFWLIATYELMRVIKQFNKGDQRISSLYQIFRRVRVPLVKFEKVKSNGKEKYPNDFNVPLSAISKSGDNFGWAISPEKIITREELAQELYDLF